MSESLCIDSPSMPKAYSGDLRERVIEAVETGASRHDAAKRFEVSVSSAIEWLQRWHESRSAAPKPRGGSVSPLEEFATAILALVELSPSSLTAIRAWLPRFPSVFFGEIFPVLRIPPFNAVVETGALSISLSSLAPNSADGHAAGFARGGRVARYPIRARLWPWTGLQWFNL